MLQFLVVPYAQRWAIGAYEHDALVQQLIFQDNVSL